MGYGAVRVTRGMGCDGFDCVEADLPSLEVA